MQPADVQATEQQRKMDYLNNRLNQVEQTTSKLGRSLDEADQNIRQIKADQSVINEELRAELRALKGSIEVLRHDLEGFATGNQKIKEDLDSRLIEMDQKVSNLYAAPPPSPSAKAPVPMAGGKGAPRTAPGTDDITRYNQILRIALDRKDYGTAIAQFRDFIRDYPNSALTDNAQYWVGEGYFAQGDFARAITEFQVVIDKYPQSEKACDAVLKQGYAFLELKDAKKAKLFLTEVTKRCPNTQNATKASERLKELAAAGAKK